MVIFGNTRRPRPPQGPPLASYPAPVRRLIFWYDDLSDWQRVQYALAASLFLLACGGYLLGLGSAMVVQRVGLEDAALAAQPLATEAAPTATAEALALAVSATATPTVSAPRPSPTVVVPTAAATRTPFSGPVIAEPPAVPRNPPVILAPPVVAPAVSPRGTPSPEKPRNVETPAAGVATSTPSTSRTPVPVPTAVRQPTARPVTPTVRPNQLPTTPLPTLAPPTTPAAPGTPVPTRPPIPPPQAATPTPPVPPAATPVKSPTVR